MWAEIVGALASLAGGALSASGGQAASNAQSKAAKDQLAFLKQQYGDTRNLLKPQYLQSGDAMNLLAKQFGIGPQNYAAAFGAGSSGADDQWTAYLNSDPALQAEWSRLSTQSKNPFSSPQEYAQYHWNTFGQKEGRQLPTMNYDAQPTGGTGQVSTTQAQNPLSGFWASPYGELATKGFLGVDQPGVAGAFGAGGKALSGAATKALYDRGQARAEGAYTNYLNGIQSLAGMNPTGQLVSSSQNFGTQGANAIGNMGQAKANALTSAYSGWGNGINGAINSLSKIKFGGVQTDPAQSAYPGYY